MTQSSRTKPLRRNHRGPNCLAILISCAAIGILNSNFQPTPLGADPTATGAASHPVTTHAPVSPTLPPSLSPSSEQAPVGTQSGGTSSEPSSQHDPTMLAGRLALQFNLLMVENGSHKCEKYSHYTATFCKQERLDGELSDVQLIELKVRHRPFSTYMKWKTGGDKGRELLYVEGQNDGDMIVKLGGLKGRFLPALKLNPNGSTAMEESRYPVTSAGLLGVAKMVAEYRMNDLEHVEGVRCRMVDNQDCEGRDCCYFCIEYDSPSISKVYRKSEIYVDKEFSVPICVTNYTWPENGEDADDETFDEKTLIEFYKFSNINFEQQLADIDFDRTNKGYRLRR